MKKSAVKKNRTCGTCSACCVHLNIDTPEFKKPADLKCINLRAEGGCSIYQDRPEVCRNWKCAWLAFDIKDSLRPDKSSVLIRYITNPTSFTLQPIGSPIEHLTNTRILEFIAGCISSQTEVAISVPTYEGFQNSRTILNGLINLADLRLESNLKLLVMQAVQCASVQKTAPIETVITSLK